MAETYSKVAILEVIRNIEECTRLIALARAVESMPPGGMLKHSCVRGIGAWYYDPGEASEENGIRFADTPAKALGLEEADARSV